MKYIIIPARGGSKGVPNKNLKTIFKISLVGWSVIHGNFIANKDDLVIVSSDSKEILDEAKKYGAKIINRPSHLSGDEVLTEPVIDHVLNQYSLDDEDIIILLQPTSPLRHKQTLRNAVDAIESNEYDSALTLRITHYLYWEKVKDKFIPLFENRSRRQDMKNQYSESGSIYATKFKNYKKNKLEMTGNTCGIMDGEEESIDIDTIIDLQVAETISHLFLDDWKNEINELLFNE